MLVQMKVMMVPIRWLEMRAQMAAQDSLDAGSRRLKWMVRWLSLEGSDESSEDEDSDGSV